MKAVALCSRGRCFRQGARRIHGGRVSGHGGLLRVAIRWDFAHSFVCELLGSVSKNITFYDIIYDT